MSDNVKGSIEPSLGWVQIVRLGMVQAALGAIVVLATSTLNRVMVVELGLAAMLPGFLVGLHYAVQVSRPVMGLRVDLWGRSTPLVNAGMAILAISSIAAAASVQVMAWSTLVGMIVSAVAFFGIGVGVSASGTALLALLARTVSSARRAAAATITWVMMIIGIIISAATAATMLDPYSHQQLLIVTASICWPAVLIAVVSVAGIERKAVAVPETPEPEVEGASLFQVLGDIWSETTVRRFAIFVFISMLAYSAQDLILEPYAGLVFGLSVGESTSLAATQHQGVLLGMLIVGVIGSLPLLRRHVPMVAWTLLGCVLSAAGLAALATAMYWAAASDLPKLVFFLGLGNGIFAVGAIGSMFSFARRGIAKREGTRVGIWGAAQAIAFALGGILATSGVDLIMLLGGGVSVAYGSIFVIEALLFLAAAKLALGILAGPVPAPSKAKSVGDVFTQGIAAMEGMSDGHTSATPRRHEGGIV